MNTTKKAWINGLFLVVTLVINTMGAFGLINGLSQKEISDMYVTLITPGPSTFSIWSVIYSLLIISIIAMIVKKNDSYYQRAVGELSGLFRLSCILNILWIVSFSYVLIELSMIFIFAFVITLAMICKKLLHIQEAKRWLLPVTFGFYTGWLFIATVVNTAAALVKLEWNGFGLSDDLWARIILIVAVVLVFAVLLKLKNVVFPLPVAWAYQGIDQFLKSADGFKGAYPMVQTVALAGMVVLIGLAVLQLYRNHFTLIPHAYRSK
jgi:hypothetical protein